jgi:hypothetical protein
MAASLPSCPGKRGQHRHYCQARTRCVPADDGPGHDPGSGTSGAPAAVVRDVPTLKLREPASSEPKGANRSAELYRARRPPAAMAVCR